MYEWQRGNAEAQRGLVRRNDGSSAGNAEGAMSILGESWMPTVQRYAERPEPCPWVLFQENAAEILRLREKAPRPNLPPRDAEGLPSTLAKMTSDKTTGMGGWAVSDLALPMIWRW